MSFKSWFKQFLWKRHFIKISFKKYFKSINIIWKIKVLLIENFYKNE